MALGSVLIAQFIGHGADGEQMVTTMHYVQADGTVLIDPSNINSIAARIDFLILADLLPCIGVDYTYDETRVTVVFGPALGAGGSSFSHGGSPGAGLVGSDTYERTLLIQKHTGSSGRVGRGRMFIPMPPAGNFLPNGQLDPAGPDVGAFGVLAAGLPTLIAVSTGIDMQPCLFGRTTHTVRPLTSCSVGPLCGVQRRRRFGIGS